MTDQEMEKLLCERYAEFHRYEEPDGVIKRFNDYGYFKALEEAQNLKTEQIPGTFYSSGNPEGIIRAVFADGGRMVLEESESGEPDGGSGASESGTGEKDPNEEKQSAGTRRFIGLLPYDVKAPRTERIQHPPVLFICWTKGNELYFVARGKNPPENPDALRQATDLFLEKAEQMDGREDLPEAEKADGRGDGLTHGQMMAMLIIAIAVVILVVIFLLFH